MYNYDEGPQRYKFTSKYDLRFIFIGLVVNYGTMLRIPCGVYKHGSSFIAAYLVLTILLGFPLIFLEIQLGQYHTRGPFNVFRICPFFEGLGICFVMFCMWFSMYYVFLMAHGMHIMAETFYTSINISDKIGFKRALRINQSCAAMETCNSYYLLPSKHFYYSPKSDNVGQNSAKLVWNISFAMCLLIAWLIIYIFTSKELIKKKYYIRWSCLSAPVIIIFLATLYIAKPNFKDYFVYIDFDDWEQYTSAELWVTALQQVLTSNGIGTGIIVTFSSYNDFNTNRIRADACTLYIVAFIVNVAVGIMFVEVAGTLKYDDDKGELLIPKTPAEIQLLYFNMIDYLPVPQLWMSILNLLFIITGGISVQLLMEVLLTTLKDNVWRKRWRNRFLHSIPCTGLFLISLIICVDTRYLYVANAVDLAMKEALVYLEVLLLLVILLIYGIDNVLLDTRFIFKQQPRGILVYLKYSWILSFIFILILIVVRWVCVSYQVYIVEIVVLAFIFSPLVGFAIYNSFKYGLQKDLNLLFKPIFAVGPESELIRQMRTSFLMSDSDETHL